MKRKLGQNFLTDKRIAEREITYANISKDDVVLEIGPGNGILTKILAEKAKKVIAIEIDKNLFEKLKNVLPNNVELIQDDALTTDFKKISNFNKIVSNLPYQISSPITFKILDCDFDLAVFIYQKEFAERLIAKPGNKNYSRLSVNAYYKAKCELLENISKTCFSPRPKVDSSIIRIIKREKPPFDVVSEEFFYFLTKKLFSHRRKKIKNIIQSFTGINLINIPYLDCRVEELTPEDIGKLSNLLYKA